MTIALRHQPLLPDCQPTGFKAQFACPEGWLGRMVGRLMARKNWAMNRFAIDVADVSPDERALEIGFAGGRALEELARRAPDGYIAGVELSGEMVAQAARRLHREIAEGRVELKRASATELPLLGNQFSLVYSANSLHHWDTPLRGLREIRRVLEPTGRLVLPLRGRHPTRSFMVAPGYDEVGISRVRALVEEAGLVVSHEARRIIGARVIHVFVARKPE